MSELKAYVCGGWSCEKEAYPKDEVDKVIAELERKVDLNKRARQYWRKEWILENKDNCHHKYKRCLAMAKWCEAQYYYYITLGNGFWLVRKDKMTRDTYHKKAEKFLTRWHKRWLELAEKFKEG